MQYLSNLALKTCFGEDSDANNVIEHDFCSGIAAQFSWLRQDLAGYSISSAGSLLAAEEADIRPLGQLVDDQLFFLK